MADLTTTAFNWLDFVCVLAFLIDKIVSAILPFDAPVLRLLRLLRLVRLLRVIRYFQALDALYVMATAMKGLSKVLLWAVVLLTSMLTTCALFLTQTLQASHFESAEPANMTAEELRINLQLYEYFGTFTRCLLSMFEITLGNW